VTLSSLNRKLLRDVLEMKGQALAVSLVVAAGVAMYVMYLSNFDSLRRTQEAYYASQRFADVFASLERAPLSLRDRIVALPGVTAVETRVVTSVTLDLEGLDQPATGKLVSVPAGRRPKVNDVFLRSGRWLDTSRPDEVIASERFAEANGFVPGNEVRAVINGRLRQLTIVGIGLSPEYIYNMPPGRVIPDDRRFGVLWINQRSVAAAFDMEGGFNDVVLALAPGASVDGVVQSLDRLLEPYGGLGAVPRTLQLSHWALENELRQLQNFGLVIPMIFLAVAIFILNVALTRALALQRPQIAVLKALGYNNAALAWHYTKWALVIGVGGVVIGVTAGVWLGSSLIDIYNQYFRFPVLLYRTPPGVVLDATMLTLAAALIGAFSAVRRAVGIPPAEAMHPESPATYRQTIFERLAFGHVLGNSGRMVLRNIFRRPVRAMVTIVGIGFAVAILMVALVFLDGTNHMLALQFWNAERQDVTVTFTQPRSAAARYALSRLPGVLAAEPQRVVPARLRAGYRYRTLSITGMAPDQRLRRIVNRDGATTTVPPSGLVLSTLLGQVLGVETGDTVTIEVLEGHRPVRDVPVAALVDDILWLSAYMDIDALHKMMGESNVVSGALLLVDTGSEAKLSRRLKLIPAVAGAGFKQAVIQSFRDTLTANINIMLTMNLFFAGLIAFGVVYNSARVSLSERSRELASLRVLGFTRVEISLILLGELAILTLISLPVGAAIGYVMAMSVVGSLESEVYRFPLVIERAAVAQAFLAVIVAAIASGLLVRRRLDRLDLIGVLKI
jgi:putative ABC transport system permease protein